MMDRDILSVRHIAEPGYSAFAVMQVSTRCIIDDLEKLIQSVFALVFDNSADIDLGILERSSVNWISPST